MLSMLLLPVAFTVRGNKIYKSFPIVKLFLGIMFLKPQLAKHLAQHMPSVKIGVVDLPKEGCCIRFNPVLSSRSKYFVSCLTTDIDHSFNT